MTKNSLSSALNSLQSTTCYASVRISFLTRRQKFTNSPKTCTIRRAILLAYSSSTSRVGSSSLTMAYKNGSSLLAKVFILSILLAIARQALAGRGNLKVARSEDMKQPEWLLKSDHSLLIPGIGRVLWPPGFGTAHSPYTGSTGGTGASGGHIPGGDNTLDPNPGTEVPGPGSVGSVPGN